MSKNRPPSGSAKSPTRAADERSGRSLSLSSSSMLGAVALLTLAAALLSGLLVGPGPATLALAAGVGLGAVVVFWQSLRALLGEVELSGQEAFALGAPSTEEEQKRAVLRAIKDVEFEHGVGKLSEDDYKALMAKYRGQAKRLLRQIDDNSAVARKAANKLVDAYLEEKGISRFDEGKPEPKPELSEPKPAPADPASDGDSAPKAARESEPSASESQPSPDSEAANSHSEAEAAHKSEPERDSQANASDAEGATS